MRLPRRINTATLAVALLAATGCDNVRSVMARFSGPDMSPPDSLPRLLNDTLPFSYPKGLYLSLISDSVTLRLHINEYGVPVGDSTRIEVPARYAEFDSAALRGATQLVFSPAVRRGRHVAYTVLFPIQFKVPTLNVNPADTTRP
jgi:hypothetical protein